VAEAIMEHRFARSASCWWRNSDWSSARVDALIASLEERTEDEWLTRGREADDLMALKALAERERCAARIADARDVRLLWDVCRIPDFRGISHAEHAGLLGRIFGFLHDGAGARRLAGAAGQADRPDRWRHRHAVEAAGIYPHMDLRRAAQGLG
jgi:ATP-dependent RNA helicase SUPV3L1/SUV3